MTDADTRADIFQNTVVKAASGLGIGVLLGRFVFRRTLPTVLFTTGFALGMACAEAGPMLAGSSRYPVQCPIDHRRPTVEIVLKDATAEIVYDATNKAVEVTDTVSDTIKDTVKDVKGTIKDAYNGAYKP